MENNKRLILFCYLLFLFLTDFLNYSKWDYTIAGWVSYPIYFSIVLYAFINKSNIPKDETRISIIVKSLMLIPFLSIINTILAGESIYEQRIILIPVSVFFMYFIFEIRQVAEIDLVKLFTVLGLLICIIKIFQQLFPQYAVFGIWDINTRSSLEDIAEKRNGLYRYRISGALLPYLCLYYYWDKLRRKIQMADFVLFFLFFLNIYLTLSRQVIVTVLFVLFFSFILSREGGKLKIIFFLSLLTVAIVNYYEVLFADFIDQTQEEEVEDNIRMQALAFYWGKICASPITFLFGCGSPSDLSIWQRVLHFYPSDIGIVGEMFRFGFFWIVLYFYTLYYLLIKHSKSLPLYIKMTLITTTIVSIMIYPYRNGAEFFSWSIILYISSLYIKQEVNNE